MANNDMEDFLDKIGDLDVIISDINCLTDNNENRSDKFVKLAVELKNDVSDIMYHVTDMFPDHRAPKPDACRPTVDKTGVNRTVINQKAFDDGPIIPMPGVNRTVINQKAFDDGPIIPMPDVARDMKMFEADAKMRSECRAKRIVLCENFKTEGNDMFEVKNYKESIKLYTKGIATLPDNTVMYTNRAQAYNHVGEHNLAIKDCKMALRIDDKLIKGYIHWSKGLCGKGDYDEAIATLHDGIAKCPEYKKVFLEYIYTAGREKVNSSMEKEMKHLLVTDPNIKLMASLFDTIHNNRSIQSGVIVYKKVKTLIKILEKDHKEYENERYFFRAKNGFKLVHNHPIIEEWFFYNCTNMDNNRCYTIIHLYTIACLNCESNILAVLDDPMILDRLLDIVCNSINQVTVGHSLVLLRTLLNRDNYVFTNHPFIQRLDGGRLVLNVMDIFQNANENQISSDLLIKLFSCRPFMTYLSKCNFSSTYMKHFERLVTHKAYSVALTLFAYALTNPVIADILSTSEIICCYLISTEEIKDNPLMLECLALMCVPKVTALSDHVPLVIHCVVPFVACAKVIGPVADLEEDSDKRNSCTYAINLICKCMVTAESTEGNLDEEVVVAVISAHNRFPEVESVIIACYKFYCILVMKYKDFIPQLITFNAMHLIMDGVLQTKHDIITGNSACTLLKLLPTYPFISETLMYTDCMQILIKTARDGSTEGIRENCAKFIAKLSVRDSRFRKQLTELEGFDILNTVIRKSSTL